MGYENTDTSQVLYKNWFLCVCTICPSIFIHVKAIVEFDSIEGPDRYEFLDSDTMSIVPADNDIVVNIYITSPPKKKKTFKVAESGQIG